MEFIYIWKYLIYINYIVEYVIFFLLWLWYFYVVNFNKRESYCLIFYCILKYICVLVRIRKKGWYNFV